MDLGNVATLKILWTEIANNMGRRPRIPPPGSLRPFPAARSGAHLVPSYRAPETLPVLYYAGTTRPVEFPGRRENGKQNCSSRTRAKSACLAVTTRHTCRHAAILNRLIRPSPHSLGKQLAGGAVRHWYVRTYRRTFQSNGARRLGMATGRKLPPCSRWLQDSALGWTCVESHGRDCRIADKALAVGDWHAFQGPFRASGSGNL